MRRSINFIIQNSNGKYLLQFRDGKENICHPLMWNFFGGKVEDNEDNLNAAVRELKEELDIDSSIHDFEYLTEKEFDHAGHVTLLKLKKIQNYQDVKLIEGSGLGFFSLQDILKINATPATKHFALYLS